MRAITTSPGSERRWHHGLHTSYTIHPSILHHVLGGLYDLVASTPPMHHPLGAASLWPKGG
jgi:hypothetical protein